jgi:hypothetical protein
MFISTFEDSGGGGGATVITAYNAGTPEYEVTWGVFHPHDADELRRFYDLIGREAFMYVGRCNISVIGQNVMLATYVSTRDINTVVGPEVLDELRESGE